MSSQLQQDFETVAAIFSSMCKVEELCSQLSIMSGTCILYQPSGSPSATACSTSDSPIETAPVAHTIQHQPCFAAHSGGLSADASAAVDAVGSLPSSVGGFPRIDSFEWPSATQQSVIYWHTS